LLEITKKTINPMTIVRMISWVCSLLFTLLDNVEKCHFIKTNKLIVDVNRIRFNIDVRVYFSITHTFNFQFGQVPL
jgi:hypothetical protein